jgi:hypothetical protein
VSKDFSELTYVKRVLMDSFVWGGAIAPLLNAVVDCLKEAMPNMKKKKGKDVPEID